MDLTALKSSELFRDMDDAELKEIESLLEEKSIEEGKTVFVENMPGEALYLIEQGTIQVTKMLAEGDEKTLVILGPEDFFGETALLDSAPRMATARVAENARLHSIRRSRFEAFCNQHPRIGLKMMRNITRTVCRRMRDNDQEYHQMMLWALGRSDS